jgi:hypothetical protein
VYASSVCSASTPRGRTYATFRANGISRLRYTILIISRLHADASVSLFAVKDVFVQPFSKSANPTIIAMKNIHIRGNFHRTRMQIRKNART